MCRVGHDLYLSYKSFFLSVGRLASFLSSVRSFAYRTVSNSYCHERMTEFMPEFIAHVLEIVAGSRISTPMAPSSSAS